MNNLYYCSACHYIYPAETARDRAFCPDCGQPGTRSASEEQKAQYEAYQQSMEKMSSVQSVTGDQGPDVNAGNKESK